MNATTSKHVLLSSGSNARGQLANGTVEDSHTFQRCSFSGQPAGVLPEHVNRILDVASGANHTILLLEVVKDELGGGVTRELWGCGDGSSGQLGLAYTQEVKARPEDDPWPMVFQRLDLGLEQAGLGGYYPLLVAASWETTYIALRSHAEEQGDVVVSMGSDDFGDLGVAGLPNVKNKGKKRSQPFHVVDLLFPTKAASKGRRVKSLNAGQHHVVVEFEPLVKDEASPLVVGWGAARHGQLGKLVDKVGKPLTSSKPTVLPYEASKGPIRSISLGMQHTVFLHTSGQITTFGSNRKGQIEGLENVSNAINLGCTWNGTYICIQKDDKMQVLSVGSYHHGQLGRRIATSQEEPISLSLGFVDWEPVPLGSRVRLACGTEHLLAQVVDSGNNSRAVVGWGWNEHGNLGTGLTEDVLVPRTIWPNEKDGRNVQSIHGIWAGCGTSWIYATLHY